eukprot:scaffold106242_cov63-Phaeocystis_antarctica.AAC.6
MNVSVSRDGGGFSITWYLAALHGASSLTLQIFKASISSSEKPARFSTSPTSSAGFGRPPKLGIEKSSKKPSCAVPERDATEPGRSTGPSAKASQLVESNRIVALIFISRIDFGCPNK